MNRTYALKLAGAIGFALSALALLTISSTADLSRNQEQVRFDVQTVPSAVVEWLPNAIQLSQDRVSGQVRVMEDAEFLMVRAKFKNATGEFCESSFDQSIDVNRGDVWTFEILVSGCSAEGVLLYAKSF